MKYHIVPVTAFQQNCTLLWCEKTNDAVLVDPGGEAPKLIQQVAIRGIKPNKILLTHGHLDHVGAAVALSQHFAIPIYGPDKADEFLLEQLPLQSQMFGFELCSAFAPDYWLTQGDKITVGEYQLRVLHCPGHTPGHVVFVCDEAKLALVGDVLFKGGIGRTDFPQSSHQQLLASIHCKLFPLGDDVQFIPGHGSMSTIGYERQTNPLVGEYPGHCAIQDN